MMKQSIFKTGYIMEKQYKYDAFISYRHTQPSRAVASRLQKILESYKPPKNVRPEGFKSWHLFRDETELPTGSNLGDDIKSALENSRFLIVICSIDTKDSQWCMQEIEYFKALHGGSNANIIAVVAQGDPTQVFPDQLCRETVQSIDENGNIVSFEREVEPLAANVVADTISKSLKKLKTEFLRVAALILGCGYDDLYKREQRRKNRRRLTISAAVAIFLALFSVYSGAMLVKISNQNDQLEKTNRSLRIQNAGILSDQAKMYYGNGEISSAVTAALESLEAGEGEILASNSISQRVISDALGVYDINSRTNITKINLSGYVRFLEFSDSLDRLIARDDTGKVYIIDSEKNEILSVFTPFGTFGDTDRSMDDMLVEGDTLYLLCNKIVLAADIQSGEEKWRVVCENYVDKLCSIQLTDIILAVSSDSYSVISKDGTNIRSAVSKNSILAEIMTVAPNYARGFSDCVYIDSENRAYVINSALASIYVFDPFTGEGEIYPLDTAPYTYPTFYMCEDESAVYINCTTNKTSSIMCFEKQDFSLRWQTQYDRSARTSLYGCNEFFTFTHNIDEGEGFHTVNGVVYVNESMISAFDVADGKMYFATVLEDSQRLIWCSDKNEYTFRAACGDGFMLGCALLVGYEGSFFGDEDNLQNVGRWYGFNTQARYAACSKDQKIAISGEKSTEILLYTQYTPDEYTVFESISAKGYGDKMYNTDSTTLMVLSDKTLTEYDIVNDVALWSTQLEAGYDTVFTTQGKTVAVSAGEKVCIYDAGGNLIEKITLSDEYKIITGVSYSSLTLSKNSVFKTQNGILYCNRDGIMLVDLSGDKAQYKVILSGYMSQTEHTYNDMTLVHSVSFGDYSLNGDIVCMLQHHSEEQIFRIAYFDMSSGEVGYVSTDDSTDFEYNSIFSLVNTPDGVIAFISKEGYIGVYDSTLCTFSKITQDGADALTIGFTPDGKHIIALCSGGDIIKYSLDTLTKNGFIKTEFSFNASTAYQFVDYDTVLVENMLIDIRTMEIKAQVKDLVHYLKTSGKLIFRLYVDGAYRYGCYDYLSEDDIKHRAYEFVG